MSAPGSSGMSAPRSSGQGPRTRSLRIGGASGFWGDSSVGAQQLLAGARLKDPALGYATDFVTVTLQELLPEIVARGIRVVSNAGGVNPAGCAAAIAALAQAQGLAVRIAVVEGDDVMGLQDTLRQRHKQLPLPPALH